MSENGYLDWTLSELSASNQRIFKIRGEMRIDKEVGGICPRGMRKQAH